MKITPLVAKQEPVPLQEVYFQGQQQQQLLLVLEDFLVGVAATSPLLVSQKLDLGQQVGAELGQFDEKGWVIVNECNKCIDDIY